MNFLLDAVVLGLILAIMPGPILITLLETALSYSRREGFFVGIGIWLSDILVMALCFTFVDQISETIKSDEFKVILAFIGGTILIAMGISSFFKKKKKIVLQTDKKQIGLDLLSFSSKGFIINTLNPFTFIFWLGVISTYTIGRGMESHKMIIFLSTIVAVIAITDTFKILLADRVGRLITGKAIENITKISGAGLILFGIVLIVRALI